MTRNRINDKMRGQRERWRKRRAARTARPPVIHSPSAVFPGDLAGFPILYGAEMCVHTAKAAARFVDARGGHWLACCYSAEDVAFVATVPICHSPGCPVDHRAVAVQMLEQVGEDCRRKRGPRLVESPGWADMMGWGPRQARA